MTLAWTDGVGTECDPENDDLQKVQSSDDGVEGSYLPQETKVEMPSVQPRQDRSKASTQNGKSKGANNCSP
jgi:hypothetical protein